MSTRTAATASPWPEADLLFRSDPRWLGSDDAYSVDLGKDESEERRTLWMFGDTFIDHSLSGSRRDSHFIRNSIGIQTGSDPSTAAIKFHWGTDSQGEPISFFEADGGDWLWPLDGAVIEGVLHLFFMKVRSPKKATSAADPIEEWREEGALGFFDVYDWHAVTIGNYKEPVSSWQIERVDIPATGGIVCGAALLRNDDQLLCYGWKGRSGFLCRWPISAQGVDLASGPDWWDGRMWGVDPSAAAVVLPGCTTEFTINRTASGRLLQLQLTGIHTGDLEVRWADDPKGPWSVTRAVYNAPEADRGGVFVYAAKAHVQLEGAELVCTYASNGRDADHTLDDLSIYYPRFVRLEGVDVLVSEN